LEKLIEITRVGTRRRRKQKRARTNTPDRCRYDPPAHVGSLLEVRQRKIIRRSIEDLRRSVTVCFRGTGVAVNDVHGGENAMKMRVIRQVRLIRLKSLDSTRRRRTDRRIAF
jgi:hypothetical protein